MPKFFKVILDDALKEGKLMLPIKFSRKYGSELQCPIFLNLPTCPVWRVEFTKCGEEGNSNFSVTIFEYPSTFEIEYPKYASSNIDKASSDNDESVVYLDEISSPSERKSKSSLFSPRPRKTTRIVPTDKTKCASKFYRPIRQELPEKLKSTTNRNGQGCSYSNGHMQKPAERETSMYLIRRASGLTSDNLVFMVTIDPSYVCPEESLYVPASCSLEKQGCVVVSMADGRTLSARYNEASDDILSGGWSQFVLNNKSNADDVCAFELIKGGEVFLKIVIFRSKEIEKCHGKGKESRSSFGSTIPEYVKGVNVFVSRNPLFSKDLRPYFLTSGFFRVPIKFFRALMEQKTEQSITLEIGGRSWPMKFKLHSGGRDARLSHGWVVFARENSLRTGDVCVLELVNMDDLLLKVYVFRQQN
ncbi:hypothetical protein ACFE04_024190 [Oxalis oulophora]